MNTGFRSVLFIIGLSAATFIPPIPPQPKPQRFTEDGAGTRFSTEEYAVYLRRTIKEQAEDDLEVVRVLVEFLSRQ